MPGIAFGRVGAIVFGTEDWGDQDGEGRCRVAGSFMSGRRRRFISSCGLGSGRRRWWGRVGVFCSGGFSAEESEASDDPHAVDDFDL